MFVAVPNVVGNKLVASLARPGGNITGLSNVALDLTVKRLEYLSQIVPSLSRPALLLDANDKDGARQYFQEAQAAADRLKVRLQPVDVGSPADLAPAFSKMRNDNIDGVVITQDGLFYQTRRAIADLGLAHRLPVIVYSRETVAAGALASFGPDNYGIFRRTGVYVDTILKGAKPAEIPVEEPTTFQFILNNKTATALGLILSPMLLARAERGDRVARKSVRTRCCTCSGEGLQRLRKGLGAASNPSGIRDTLPIGRACRFHVGPDPKAVSRAAWTSYPLRH